VRKRRRRIAGQKDDGRSTARGRNILSGDGGEDHVGV
jgi:hypothetical protein